MSDEQVEKRPIDSSDVVFYVAVAMCLVSSILLFVSIRTLSIGSMFDYYFEQMAGGRSTRLDTYALLSLAASPMFSALMCIFVRKKRHLGRITNGAAILLYAISVVIFPLWYVVIGGIPSIVILVLYALIPPSYDAIVGLFMLLELGLTLVILVVIVASTAFIIFKLRKTDES